MEAAKRQKTEGSEKDPKAPQRPKPSDEEIEEAASALDKLQDELEQVRLALSGALQYSTDMWEVITVLFCEGVRTVP